MKKTGVLALRLALLGSLAICAPLWAQQPPDNGGGPGPDQQQGQPDRGRMGRPPGGGINQMLDRLKNDLTASDVEWTTISPKIKMVLQIEHELYAGPGGPQGGPPGGRAGGPDGGPNDGPNGGPNGGPQGNDQGGPNGHVNADAMGGGNGAPPPPDGGPNDGDHSSTTQPSAATIAEADAIRQAKRSLGQLIHDPDASSDELKAALKTLQDARAAAKTVLVKTQNELMPMVNDRQHAILVAFGILD